ncbi:kinase domain-containing protein [Cucurbitaria berberidis CBS 394.84]|uniref:non-specific serine/threonine protein kinase n=1 Tax=Cucurbitaria berberidis CBS 394.84 TaxID=1168544 RepID=A0A9P4L3W1_9PLEO|nr:kinase domain-containing protein [Cucurbitaria berberidis CBS 394.84]KAF1841371.1 kinase domain-containing protein [Cucurbitaria berberidis CBS 394.84]
MFKLAKSLFRRQPWPQLRFPSAGFDIVGDGKLLEEEQLDEFRKGVYYPVNIGDVFASKYQVVGKLGFGVSSTVCRHAYATLKVFTREKGMHEEEYNIYQILGKGNASHPGYGHVRTALDIFTIPRQGGDHRCLVQKPMWDSFRDLLNRNPTHRFTDELLRATLPQVLLALDYLHSECNIVHTDIKADNIMIEIEDQSILDAFVDAELAHPSPRKIVDGKTIYASRGFSLPKEYGKVVLSDFGSAVRGDQRQVHDAQPNVYRCPEVMLQTEWSYPADVWNVGAMIWDLYEDKHLFHGNHPEDGRYMTKCHLAEVVAMLGPPPGDLLERGSRSKEFFDKEGTLLNAQTRGNWIADVPIPELTLESLEENLEQEAKREFLEFVRCMLQWSPEDRKTAKQLLEHPWLKNFC